MCCYSTRPSVVSNSSLSGTSGQVGGSAHAMLIASPMIALLSGAFRPPATRTSNKDHFFSWSRPNASPARSVETVSSFPTVNSRRSSTQCRTWTHSRTQSTT